MGFLTFIFKPIALLYAPIILLVGLVYVIKNKNRNNEVLLVSAYIVGIEVFLRMTNAMYFNEFAKYSVIIFMMIGIFFSGISQYSFIFLCLLLLLIPSVFMGMLELSHDQNVRKAIAFNISGPVTLLVVSVYTFNRAVTYVQLKQIFLNFIYPLSAMLVYIFLFTPSLKDAITGTDSNFVTSGGFGPNQVSTVLGLGMFALFSIGLLFSKNKFLSVVFFSLLALFTYRGLLTFSRGGLLAGLVVILVLVYFVFKNSKAMVKGKLIMFSLIILLTGGLLFSYTALQTGGLLTNRYTGKDALGREKTSKFSGREKLATTEIELFLENPILGIGVGKIREEREERTGEKAATHNEITRMLAEHGFFGILILLTLITLPIIVYFNDKQNIFLFSFYLFWLITINHAAMRIAAPAFIYGLTLINLKLNASKPPLHRQHP